MVKWRCTFKKTEDDNGVTIVSYKERIYHDGLIWAVGKASAYATEYGLEIVSITAFGQDEDYDDEC